MKEDAGGEGAGVRRGSNAEAATAGFDLDRELLSRSGSLGRAGRRHGSGTDGLPGPELGFGGPSAVGRGGRAMWRALRGWRASAGGGAPTGVSPSGAGEVEGAGKQGGGGWIWLVAQFSRGMRRLRVGEG